MGYDLTNVLVFFAFAIAFVVVTVSVLSYILRPRVAPADEPAKTETYECGEPTIGSSWVRFDIRFYTVALLFLIFDVEVAFLYPWAVIYEDLRAAGMGLFVFTEAILFLVILVVGFVYCWKKGDLDWIKSAEGQPSRAAPRRPRAREDRRPEREAVAPGGAAGRPRGRVPGELIGSEKN